MFPFRKILLLLLSCIPAMAFSQSGYYPPPSSVAFHNDTLTIFPPDSLPVDPVVLLGYNIYVDSIFFDNITAINPEDPVYFIFEIPELLPGNHVFCTKACYNEWISDTACDTGLVIYGNELPFLEDWSSGSFETLQWMTDSDHWVINSYEGNPSPSVSFQGEPGLTQYEAVLESYPLNATGMIVGKIWLDFDLSLVVIQSTNYEKLCLQIWNSSNQDWTTVAEYLNENGSFYWVQEHISINYYCKNQVFKIRFQTNGENSADISSWSIDNIHIYRNCDPPYDLEIEENWEYNKLTWIGNNWFNPFEWMHWDDGVNSGNSIGTNDSAEFDVASKWSAIQLPIYNGYLLDEIAFFPSENEANYNLRVWTGSGPDTLVIDQPVISPVINEWNYVTVDNPVEIDSTKDLWIGYHISTPTGYPAGVDDGPAIDGYGNMMYYDGNWSTLLEINPELDYNWNIAGHINGYNYGADETFYIYRDKNQEGFEFLDVTNHLEYIDSNIVLSNYYCYKVSEIWVESADTCESTPTNTACEIIMLGTGLQEESQNIRVYPNPVNDQLNIEAEEMIREVRLYNPLGEMVVKLEIGNSQGIVDVSGLEKGLYFVEVICESRSYKSKVLVH